MENLNNLRTKINKIDFEIISKIEQRLTISKKIGYLKKEQKIATRNKKRELEIENAWYSAIKIASPLFTKKLLHLILKESRQIQKNLIKQK